MRARGLGYIYQRGRVWWAQYCFRGIVHRESSGSTNRMDAVKLLRRRFEEMGRGRLVGSTVERTTFEDLVQMLLDDYRTNRRRSLDRVERAVAHLRKQFNLLKAVDVTTDRITRYVAARQDAGATNGTINRELSALKRMFRLGERAGKVVQRPHISALQETNVRQGFFEEATFRALLRHLPEEVKPVASFGYITGWRVQSEVLPLTWAQVEFKGGVVRLEPGTTKNREGRTFPMFPELRSLLDAQKAYTEAVQREQGCIIPWVFHRNGKSIRSFRRSWRTACQKAGQPGRIPHDFRRTAVRNMVRKGIAERVAMQLTGHKTRSVFERYNIVSEGDLQEAGRRLTGSFLLHHKDLPIPPLTKTASHD